MASMNVSVMEIPECERNKGRQICRLSTRVTQQCGLSFLSCVRIRSPQKTVICRVYPGVGLDDFIKYDALVTENTAMALSDQRAVSCARKARPKVDVQCLECRDGKEASVKLILKDISRHKQFLSQSHVQADLAKKCVRCMRGIYITPGCTVDLSQSRLAKLYGFLCCVVLSCSSDHGETDSSSAVRITETTEIKISDVQSWDCYQAIAQTSATREDIVGGLQEERQILTDLLTLPGQLSRSKGVLLRGPPGCGKTSLVQQVARDCSAALLVLNGPEVLSSNPGESETNLASMFDKAARLSQEVLCILFIDEIDSICPKRGSSSSTNSSRLATALLTQLDNVARGCGLLVVMATNRPSALDPDLRRPGRLDREILISVPTADQRRQILDLHLRRLPLADDIDLHKLSLVTPGYVGADLGLVCKEALRKAWSRQASLGPPDKHMENCLVMQADLEASVLKVQPSLQRGVECVVDVCSVPWSDVGGLDDVKLRFQQAVEWPMLYPETYQALGLPLTKGVLLYGPPGCGKTTLVQAAATASRVTFLSLNCASLYSPYVGDSEKKVSETFQKARALAPSILFLDEIDSIVGKRSESTSSSGVSERVLSALLNEMDGVGVRFDDKTDSKVMEEESVGGSQSQLKQSHGGGRKQREDLRGHVLVVGATNRPDQLDAALLRPGRMDQLIYVPPPDLKGRHQAFKVHTKRMPLADDVDLHHLAGQTSGYTGADIRAVCQEAGLVALTESLTAKVVCKAHFEQALRGSRPSLPTQPDKVEAKFKQLHR